MITLFYMSLDAISGGCTTATGACAVARCAGHEAQHVADCDMQSAPDRSIWDFAAERGCVIITKDEDFARRRAVSVNGPQIVWLRIPNSRRQYLLKWFEQALPGVLQSLARNEVIVEVF